MRDRRILPSVTQKGMFLNHAKKRHKTALHISGIPLNDLPREAVIIKLAFDDRPAVAAEYLFHGGV